MKLNERYGLSDSIVYKLSQLINRESSIYAAYKKGNKIFPLSMTINNETQQAKIFMSSLIKIFESIEKEAEIILNRYYKSDERKSIEIVQSESFKKLINIDGMKYFHSKTIEGNVKSAYIKSSNLNFFDYKDNVDNPHITAISKQNMKLGIFNSILHKYCRIAYELRDVLCSYRVNGRISDKINEEDNSDLSSKLTNLIILSSFYVYSRIRDTKNILSGDVLDNSSILKKIKDHVGLNGNANYELALKDLDFIIKKINSGNLCSNMVVNKLSYGIKSIQTETTISSAINSTYDFLEKKLNFIEKFTKGVTKSCINPYNGLEMIVKYRVPKTDDISKEKCDSEFSKLTEINYCIEKIGERLKIAAAEKQEKNTNKNLIVDGDDIVKYYNASSYSNKSGGTLWNSCMRYAEQKDKISFYAKNKNLVKLIIRLDDNLKSITSRALVWMDNKNKKGYVDRIYSISEAEYMSFISYINSIDNFYYIHPNESSNKKYVKSGIPDISIDNIKCSKETPYFDSIASVVLSDNELKISKSALRESKKEKAFTIGGINISNPEVALSEAIKNTCVVCGKNISVKSNSFEMKNGLCCLSHIKITDEDKILIEQSNKELCDLNLNKEKAEYVSRYISTNGNSLLKSKSKLNFIEYNSACNELQYKFIDIIFNNICNVSRISYIHNSSLSNRLNENKIYYDETCEEKTIQVKDYSTVKIIVPKEKTERVNKLISVIEYMAINFDTIISDYKMKKHIIKNIKDNIDKYVISYILNTHVSSTDELSRLTNSLRRNYLSELESFTSNANDGRYAMYRLAGLIEIDGKFYADFNYSRALIDVEFFMKKEYEENDK